MVSTTRVYLFAQPWILLPAQAVGSAHQEQAGSLALDVVLEMTAVGLAWGG